MAGTLRITALTGTGAEVSGVDVRRLDQQQFDDIRQAFADYGLLFFRDQQLTETEHLALAEHKEATGEIKGKLFVALELASGAGSLGSHRIRHYRAAGKLFQE